ncbi:MAG TPA: hypothetical protein VK152_02585 [Paludibacter sp.]|nr:hypothetical protein [Paludibacter sp.]
MERKDLLAPICLFVYSRLVEAKMTVESLKRNRLAAESQLFVFSDGPVESNKEEVQAVRDYIHGITGFANVTIYESGVNKGLANSIISGVSMMFKDFSKVIVLEDDLLLSTNFLCFMNEALDFYENKKRVLSVSGYSLMLKYPGNYPYDTAYSLRASSWGWATWNDRWEEIDWDVKSYNSFKFNIFKRLRFNWGGSDMSHMLDKQMNGRVNSWAIRFCYHQYEHNMLDVFPVVSKVANVGFGEAATNTKKGLFSYNTTLDCSNKTHFNMQEDIRLSVPTLLQMKAYHSILVRALTKIF